MKKVARTAAATKLHAVPANADEPSEIETKASAVTAKVLRVRALVHLMQEAASDRFSDDPLFASITETCDMVLELVDAANAESSEVESELAQRRLSEVFLRKADAWDRAQRSLAVRRALVALDRAIEADDKDAQRAANAQVQYELSKFESMQVEQLVVKP